MSRIKGKNTKPELAVRSLLHKMGYRFRLYGKISKKICKNGILPGKPDIVLAKHKTVIFVHGCFWHMHKGCKNCKIPKTNRDFWKNKLQKNVTRHNKNKRLLEKLGFKVIVIWECETRDLGVTEKIIRENL